MSRLLIVAIIIVCATVTGFAQVPSGEKRSPESRPDPLFALQQTLNLSASQVEAVLNLMDDRAEAEQTAFESVREKQQELETIQNQQSYSAAEIETAVQAIQEAGSALTTIRDKFLLDFGALLTPDQKKLLIPGWK